MPQPKLPIPFDGADNLAEQVKESLFANFVDVCDGALIVDRETRIVWISDRYLDLLDRKREEVMGRITEEILPNSLMRQVVETGQPIMLDIMDYGKASYVVMRMPLRDASKNVVGAIGFVLFDDTEQLTPIVSRFTQMRNDLTEARKKLVQREAKYSLSSFIGRSALCLEVKQRAMTAARTNSPVLILGETGTGKEVLAHAIHQLSSRVGKPLVAINVAAIPETLLEAEFFGVSPGAYTGAERKGREGKFALAQGGTIFLDEIGDMPIGLQTKLLRVIQEAEVEPIGSNRLIALDVRIIAATSRNLREDMTNGRFRSDLYYRLSVFDLHVPPLRERLEDIPLLCDALIEKICRRLGVRSRRLTREAMHLLATYHWPGNVRELSNFLEHCVLMAGKEAVLTEQDIERVLNKRKGFPTDDPHGVLLGPATLNRQVAEAERIAIHEALTAARGNKKEAARRLGISRTSLYEKLSSLGMK